MALIALIVKLFSVESLKCGSKFILAIKIFKDNDISTGESLQSK